MLQTWPLLGGNTYHLGLGKGVQGGAGQGIFYTTVPIVLGASQILGSGRAKTGSGKTALEDGSTGTVIRACDGNGVVTTSLPAAISDNACTFGDPPNQQPLYFPNAPPKPPGVTGAATFASDGALSPGTYYWKIAWVVNLATGCDSRFTLEWPVWTTVQNKLIPAGTCLQSTISGTNYTQVALNQGHTSSSSFSWNGVGQKTQDNEVTWLNIGPYSTEPGGQTPYGTPGISLPSDEQTASIGVGSLNNAIRFNSGNPINVSVTDYAACSPGTAYSTGAYVTRNSRLYRAIGVSDPARGNAACPTDTTSGVQSADANNNPSTCNPTPPTLPTGNCLYWQEVGSASGSPLPYLPVVGYVVYASTSHNTEVIASSIGCATNSTVQVGALTACKINTSYTLKSLACDTGCFHVPVVDTTHPLIVLGERISTPSRSLSTFMSRVQDLTADANNIAGSAVTYIYGQEQSGAYAINALSGSEATIVAVGPGTQNSMLYDFVVSNPNNDLAYYHQQRLAGVYLDARDGQPMKTVLHGTITPYNNPSTTLGPDTTVPAGIAYIGGDDITMESVHTENVQDGILCDGDVDSSSKPNCYILSTDAAAGNVGKENNTVHIGSQTNSYFVNTVKAMSDNALLDDTISLVTGAPFANCSFPYPTTSFCYTQNGIYQGGVNDGNKLRTRILTAPLQVSWFDGPMFLTNSGNAGSLGFQKGSDVSSWPAWVANNVATIEGAPDSAPTFGSYRFTLPAGAKSGIFQGLNSVSNPDIVTGTFSGDDAHSKHNLGNTGTIAMTDLCSAGCNVAGLYHVHWSFVQTTACSGGGSVTFLLWWTDNNGTSHPSQQLPMFDGSSLSLPGGVFRLQPGPSLAAAWASGDFNVYKDASHAIQYGTGYSTSCPGGGHYDLLVTVTELQ
ncbi:MAG: hypothetical protein LAO09_14965 [Acidobacteriia bacterium]|nr:hypothetical protein [Terriglobia bacterium]